MSSTPPADFAPVLVGDLVAATRSMRAWRAADVRGDDGHVMAPGERALVIGTWLVGNQRRLSAVVGQRVLLFSCPDHAVARNWCLVRRG